MQHPAKVYNRKVDWVRLPDVPPLYKGNYYDH